MENLNDHLKLIRGLFMVNGGYQDLIHVDTHV